MKRKIILLLTLILLLSLSISGCVIRAKKGFILGSQQGAYLPPTMQPTVIPTITPTPTPIVPTQPANCMNLLTFLADNTVPDGSSYKPGATIDKRWLVENSGTCHWNETYEVRLVTGDAMGVEPSQPMPLTASGDQAEVAILFTAPSTPGGYQSAWQGYTGSGMPFGDVFYIDIVVE
jgi:hypothetical protein